AYRHLIVQARTIPNLQHDTFLLRSLESRSFHLDVVMSDRKIGGGVLAVATGGEVVRLTGFRASESNRCIGNGASARVGHSADNGRILAERLACYTEKEHAKKQCVG